jgi:hypothetical protein
VYSGETYTFTELREQLAGENDGTAMPNQTRRDLERTLDMALWLDTYHPALKLS